MFSIVEVGQISQSCWTMFHVNLLNLALPIVSTARLMLIAAFTMKM